MDLRSGYPFWLIRNGLPSTFPALRKNERCDVVVVGAGITGALVSYQLAQAGLSVVVVDERHVAWGSTAASTALLQYEIDVPLHELEEMRGRENAVGAYLACWEAISKIEKLSRALEDDCDFKRCPSLYLATQSSDMIALKKEFLARRRAGLELDLWSAAQLKAKTGVIRPGALFSKDAAQIDPYRFVYHLLKAAQGMGVRIYDRTVVKSYEADGRGVRVKTDGDMTLRARHIVFATGYESQQFLPQKLVELHSTYALVSEPIAGRSPLWHRESLIWEHADPYLYLRTTSERRIIIGGEDDAFENPLRRDALIPHKTKILLRKFKKLFPHIACEVAFAWAGTFGTTKDGLAYIGAHPDFPRAFFTLGFGGNGMTYSVLAGEIVRDSILKRKNKHAHLFSLDR